MTDEQLFQQSVLEVPATGLRAHAPVAQEDQQI
jgi:hypothetical protein